MSIKSNMWSVLLPAVLAVSSYAEIGSFDASRDFDNGRLGAPGSAVYDPATSTYVVEGSGDDIWNEADAFHYVYKEFSGDFVLIADVSVEGGLPEQDWIKSVLMARESLTPESKNVATRIRRDGQYSLQWRDVDGDTDSKDSTPGDLRVVIDQGSRQKLERQGDTFICSFLDENGEWVEVDRHDLAMEDPIFASSLFSVGRGDGVGELEFEFTAD